MTQQQILNAMDAGLSLHSSFLGFWLTSPSGEITNVNNRAAKALARKRLITSEATASPSVRKWLKASSRDCGHKFVRKVKAMLKDIEVEGYSLSLVTGGGQPHAVLHPNDVDLQGDGNFANRPGVYDLGKLGVGDMIAL